MGAHGGTAVLVADDDSTIRTLCRVNLELEGYRVLEASTSAEIEHALASDDIAAVLLDVHLGTEDGAEIARRIRSDHPSVRIAFLTGDGRRGDPPGEGADGFLPKPFSLEELSTTVASLVRGP
jgi:two-component system OmpR family response regulator